MLVVSPMATIDCPICNLTLWESDPSSWMNPVAICGCDHEQTIYIATDSNVDGLVVLDDHDEEVDYLTIDQINRKLGTDFEMGVQAYHPIKAQDLIDDAKETWNDGCECFGRYEEPGCLSCLIDYKSISPVEIHLTTWDDKTKTRENAVGFVGDDLEAFSDAHLTHGALWTTDAIPPFAKGWGELKRTLVDPNFSTINRRMFQ